MTSLFGRRLETLARAAAEAGISVHCRAYIKTTAGAVVPETGDELGMVFAFSPLTCILYGEVVDGAEGSEEGIAAISEWFKVQIMRETMRHGAVVWQRDG